jgi:hypothetical protein
MCVLFLVDKEADSVSTMSMASGSTRAGKSMPVSSTVEKSFIGSVALSTVHNSENPFRRAANASSDTHGVVTHSRTMPRPAHLNDPLDYKDEMFIRSVGSFNACVKPELKIGGTPSRTEVTDTLIKLTRKTILSYNARIVETGAALRVRIYGLS